MFSHNFLCLFMKFLSWYPVQAAAIFMVRSRIFAANLVLEVLTCSYTIIKLQYMMYVSILNTSEMYWLSSSIQSLGMTACLCCSKHYHLVLNKSFIVFIKLYHGHHHLKAHHMLLHHLLEFHWHQVFSHISCLLLYPF